MIEQTIVDGVPTLFAQNPGPMRAGLTFRVGRADETLARGGITHLIEHLSLYHLNLADYHFNGATGAVTTDFHLEGSAQDITAFLRGVCEALHNLPLHRLEVEKEVLRTEENSRSNSVLQPFPLWRYGARGWGLRSYPEFGLSMLTPDDLRAWAARYFTKDNVVLWLAGPEIPAGLSLPLPGGARQPLPAVTSALPSTPAFFYGEGTTVAFEATMARRTAGSVFAGVLERELFRALRQESGLSYTAAATYEPRGDGYASIIAIADALPEKQHAVLGGFVDVLAKLRVGNIDPADVPAATAKLTDVLDRPDVEAGRVPGAAFNLLTGFPILTTDQLRAELLAVTVADVHAVAQEVAASGLLMAPQETAGAEWAGYLQAPNQSTTTVTGTRYPHRTADGVAVVIGAEGVSWTSAQHQTTVLFAECAALLRWPDGGRHLIGYDGIGVRVEPTLIDVPAATLAQLDAAVPPATQVTLPAREPDSIPQPRPRAETAPAAAAPAGRGRGERIALAAVKVIAVVFVCLAVVVTAGTALDEKSRGDGFSWAVTGVIWVIAAAVTLPAVLLRRRKRA